MDHQSDREGFHVVKPVGKHTHTMIFVHGCDNTASNFAKQLFSCRTTKGFTLAQIFPHVKWVFPTASKRSHKISNIETSQWFDIYSTSDPYHMEEIQIAGIEESSDYIASLISHEATLVSADHVFLGGISQGSAVAIHALMLSRRRLGGYIAFSSWMPLRERFRIKVMDSGPYEFRSIPNPAVRTPAFVGCCMDDEVIHFRYGVALREHLRAASMDATVHVYEEGGNWINEPHGLDDIVAFIKMNMKK